MTVRDTTDAGTTGNEDATVLAPPPDYDEVIVSQDVRIPFVPAIITPPIERPLRNGRYEKGECMAMRSLLGAGDRLLELGAGIGLVSTIAAQVPGVEAVVSVEANPQLMPLIRETHRLNGIANVTLLNGAAAPGRDGGTQEFYLRRDFWASSMAAGPTRFVERVEVPRFGLATLVEIHRPTVIVCDIEGGELGLFETADLSGVHSVALEFHPKVYGEAGKAQVIAALEAQGFRQQPWSEKSSVQLFRRDPDAVSVRFAASTPVAAEWPPETPRILVATCMKDEGPFLLEWVAWNRAIGVTDTVVFTNDCTDGTDLLLDRLDAMGILTHLPNPAVAAGSTYYQPTALKFVQQMPVFRQADYFLSIDVDEFVNVRTGEGRIADLLSAAGPFDVLSMFELNHGSNRHERFERGWVTDLFPRHQTERPGARKSVRGVKSLVRLSPRIAEVRNHRPDLAPNVDPVWLDGSGRPLPVLAADRGLNGADCRGGYDLVRLEHYPLRSLDSYLVKMFRGDVVVSGKRVSARYWRVRNRNEEATSTFGAVRDRARAEFAGLLSDPGVARLHEAACAAHEARIAALAEAQEYRDRRAWVLREAW